jgi:hypothetical protein
MLLLLYLYFLDNPRTMMEFLNLCQDGTNASICPDIVVNNNDMSVTWTSYIYVAMISHLIVMT